MIKEAIGTGSTIEEAKENALKALAAPEGIDPGFELLEAPKEKKFLGLFGGSPAKVRVFYEVKEEKKPEKKAEAPKKAPAKKEAPVAPKQEAKEEVKTDSTNDKKFDCVKNYLNTIFAALGVEKAEYKIETTDEDCRISVECGDDYGSVIGRRGETLDAIQYLTRLVINRECGDYKHVSINVGDYREKREATLTALAKKNAAKVKKYGRNVVLEPMNPYERRIIHTAIQEIEGVTSHSVGSDDDRKVVITLEEGFKPTNGGYNRGGRNDRGGRGGRGGYNKPRTEQVSSAPTREPRSDSEGLTSFYGKIK